MWLPMCLLLLSNWMLGATIKINYSSWSTSSPTCIKLWRVFAIALQLQHEKSQTMQQTLAKKAMQSFNKRYKA
jgi:hypothetical protein